MEIDYDPERIGYEDLLALFFSEHDARRASLSKQYRSAVFYRTSGERAAAEAAKTRIEAAMGQVSTSVEPLRTFYRAEDYHQKYYWKQFARQWQRRTAGQTPDWHSPEFCAYTTKHGI